SYRVSTRAERTADEYGMILSGFLRLAGFAAADAEGVIIASVVPKAMHSFRAAVFRFLSVEPMVVGPGVRTGVDIRLDDPRSLGADCLADC
ncbi:type III pantothenate kinase, partial [Bifidobacterium aemilianum]